MTAGKPTDAVSIPRASNECGFKLSTVGSYLRDNTPNNEPKYSARFYFRPEGAATTTGTTIFQGLNSSGTAMFRVAYVAQTSPSISTLKFYVHTASNTELASSPIEVAVGKWHGIQVRWEAGTGNGIWYRVTKTASDGSQTLTDAVVSSFNAGDTIDWVQLGAIGGSLSTAIEFDAFASRRLDWVPLLCHCDANGDRIISVADQVTITNEITGSALAAGQPDCNADGFVSVADKVINTNMALASTVCPNY